jgi:hypothetical protein
MGPVAMQKGISYQLVGAEQSGMYIMEAKKIGQLRVDITSQRVLGKVY